MAARWSAASHCRHPRSHTFRLRRIASDDQMLSCMVKLTDERDVDTLRQISLLLDRENQRLITKNLQLTAELARLRGVPTRSNSRSRCTTRCRRRAPRSCQREDAAADASAASPAARARAARQPALPSVEIRHELAPDQRQCPACGGEVTEMAGQYEILRAHHDREAHLSGRAPPPAEVSLCVQRCGRHRVRPARMIPGGGMRRRLRWASRSRSTRTICPSNAKCG